jgi:hypothetical protein
MLEEAAGSRLPFCFHPCALNLDYSQQVQYHEDDRDNDQNMDPITCFGEAGTDPPTKSTEQPQDQ